MLLVVGVVLAFFLPLWVRGEVVLAEDVAQTATLAEADPTEPRPFLDQSSVFVPELAHQLSDRRDGWISTWNTSVAMGRPAWQVNGLSKAYMPTHVLTWLVDDPYVLYTLLVALAVLLSVVFGYLLLESLELRPAACIFGALVLGLGFYVTFWLTFVLYLWGVCWTLALLWMGPRFLDRPTLGRAVFIAFATYSLLLTAYPQQIVWHAYLLALVLGTRVVKANRWRSALLFGCAALVGVASAAPVYLDLALAAARSARPDTDVGFFAATLPVLDSPRDAAALAVSVFDAYWFGRPLFLDYPLAVRGVSWTPAVCVLLPLALGRWRRAWPWAVFAAATVLFAVVRPLHAFGVEYLGLSISRHAPMAAAHIPVGVLAALAGDRVLRGELGRVRACVGAALVPIVAAVCAFLAEPKIDLGALSMGLALALGTLAFVGTGSRLLLVALGVGTVFGYGLRSCLSRPLADTRVESPLAEILGTATADGSRYVWVGMDHTGALHPNKETLYGLRSVHYNDSLSSRSYHEWMERVWTVRVVEFGRLFARLPEGTRPHPHELSFGGISTIVHRGNIELSGTAVDRVRDMRVTRLVTPPLLEAQFGHFGTTEPGHVELNRGKVRGQPVRRIRDLDDALTFELDPARKQTLLFVSQQHHPQWVATADGRSLETPVVDGLYQGVLVPPGTERVQLRFRPWVRWSWIPS